jgi:hypothetical protein
MSQIRRPPSPLAFDDRPRLAQDARGRLVRALDPTNA